MDFAKAFTHSFEDQDWLQKIGIMALIALIPIIGQIVVTGWMLDITRRVIRGEYSALPELDFGEHLTTGLKAWVVTFVYNLPAVLFVIPIAILGQLTENNNANAFLAISLTCMVLIILAYAILINLIVPAALGNLAAKGDIGDGLRFGEVFKLFRDNLGGYLLVLLGVIVVGFISPLGSILCIVGAALTSVYGAAVLGHLYGQAYRQARPASVVEVVDLPNPS